MARAGPRIRAGGGAIAGVVTRRDIATVALATLCSRAILIAVWPEQFHSLDPGGWLAVIDALAHHRNPYETGFLNWPPLWMQVLYALSKIATATGIGFITVLRCFLTIADTVNAVLMLWIARRFLDSVNATMLVVAGFALNPIALLLTIQHGNFDALPVMAMLGFAIAMLRYRESHDSVDWLTASLALGLAVLAKTFPLVLAPILAWRSRALPIRTRILGALLLAGPAAYGMSVIYVLAPADVTRSVLRYRSTAGSFGITGLLSLGGSDAPANVYGAVFPFIALAALAALTIAIARRSELPPRDLVLLIGAILASLIAFGSGYATQYIAWVTPFFLLTFASFDNGWRRDVLVAWIVAIVTYAVEYALLPFLGGFLVPTASPRLWQMIDVLNDNRALTLFQLPLFAAYLWLIRGATVRLRSPRSPAARPLPGTVPSANRTAP